MGGDVGRSRVEEACGNHRDALLGFLRWKQLLGEVTQRLTFAGTRPQPRVHFQRRALRLPENTSYSDLTAFLTATSSPSEVDSFPYLRGLDGNGTGNSSLCSFQTGLLGFILYIWTLDVDGTKRVRMKQGKGSDENSFCRFKSIDTVIFQQHS
jgi:hypothetical protein